MRRRCLLTAAAASALLLVSACSDRTATTAPAGGRLLAFVSIPPQATFVERIGGEHVAVEVLVQPGQSPHTFEPTPRQMAHLAEARVYFSIGLPFEQTLLPKIASACPDLVIVDTCKGIHLAPDHEDHGHGELDPHVWLDPKLAKLQADTICRALCRLEAEHADQFRANLATLQADLDALDREIAAALAPLRGRTLYVFHPALGYFARSYGLKQRAVETGGRSPGPRQIAELITQARADGVKVIFVQPQFSTQSAKTIARAIDGAVVPIDPLAPDYFANLRETAKQIAAALGSERQITDDGAQRRQDPKKTKTE